MSVNFSFINLLDLILKLLKFFLELNLKKENISCYNMKCVVKCKNTLKVSNH